MPEAWSGPGSTSYEGTIPALDSFGRYVQCYGMPLALCTDKHTTYRSPAEPKVAEQLAGRKPQIQFKRSLAELGVEVLHAHSPQAKGLVERIFKTFQDRLIKELCLAGLATLEEANCFLEGYLPLYNRRFAVPPAQVADLHRPQPASGELDRILCIKTIPCLRKDFTIAHHGGSIRFTAPSGPPTCWWKSAWMGRCGSRPTVGRSAFT